MGYSSPPLAVGITASTPTPRQPPLKERRKIFYLFGKKLYPAIPMAIQSQLCNIPHSLAPGRQFFQEIILLMTQPT